MMFYHYSQNNSGGVFDLTDTLTHHVVIEANSAAEADATLESLGGYFNGCDAGMDCHCCGDRWSTAWDEGDESPLVYGKSPADLVAEGNNWMAPGKEVVVHFSDGRVEWY